MTSLVWFRETDCRMHDNTALTAACNQDKQVIAVFFITPVTWQDHNIAACRIEFLLKGLKLLEKNLKTLNIPFLVFNCATYEKIPDILKKLTVHFDIQHIFANKQYEVNELKRDQAVEKLLQNQCSLNVLDDCTVIPPDKIKTQKGDFYTVFTPFKKAWIEYYQAHLIKPFPIPKKREMISIKDFKHQSLLDIPNQLKNFDNNIDMSLWPTGEKNALKALDQFIKQAIKNYQSERDFPALDSTSKLSPYLAAGMLSPRTCLQKAIKANHDQLIGGNKAIDCWISEIIWREFYKHILVGFPRVCRNRPFQLKTEKITWDENHDYFKAWQQGQTGFPLVDAAMRQLNQTGWMHNRLRMLTAMFLSKFLWLDWRLGEKYFMQHLIDGDFASNNGGWQWSASTGTDAAPYFRIFNPITQSEKFDPKGDFIRAYCPELKKLNNKIIHNPYAYDPTLDGQLNYPKPIIDYKATREHAIEAFKGL